MRPNRYTYIFDYDENKFIVFNGLNKNFLLLEKSLQNSYEAIIAHPDEFAETHPEIITELIVNGLVVEDDFNEFEQIQAAWNQFTDNGEYHTVLVPTYECNYKCWYCTQNHMPVEIDDEKINLIIKHIKKYLIDNSLKHYTLSWFGGEPLTQIGLIDRIASELIEFCDNNGIEFHSNITTNGALLTPEAVEILMKSRVTCYQIAIDGDKKSHDRNKYDDHNPSSFELVLGNMAYVAEKDPNAQMNLRLNATPGAIEDTHLVDEINRIIPASLRHKFFVDFHHIWQISELNYKQEKLNQIHKAFAESGYTLVPYNLFTICYVEKRHYATIFYNGKVEMCDNKDIAELRGCINENGDIEWNEEPRFRKYNVFGSKSACTNCNMLPLCLAGCPVHREDSITENGEILCVHKNKYDLLEHRLKDFCSRVINNQNNSQKKE